MSKMRRKITKNKHQYKVNLPVELVRKLSWSEKTDIKFHEVSTPLGKGMLIVKDHRKAPLRLEMGK